MRLGESFDLVEALRALSEFQEALRAAVAAVEARLQALEAERPAERPAARGAKRERVEPADS